MLEFREGENSRQNTVKAGLRGGKVGWAWKTGKGYLEANGYRESW